MLFRRRYTPPEEEAYRRIRAKGFNPASIIDVGAYEGNWTRLARSVFDAPVIMVEAQAGKAPILEKVAGAIRDVDLITAVLAAEEGQTVTFHEMETGSSMMPESSNVGRKRVELVTRTLDSVAEELPAPIFLKIDVQGAELEVLKGGSSTLPRCELIQLEVALVPYNEGAPTMLQVLAYMDEKGFVPLDISGFSRPNGIDLAQIDLLFVPKTSSLRRTFFEF